MHKNSCKISFLLGANCRVFCDCLNGLIRRFFLISVKFLIGSLEEGFLKNFNLIHQILLEQKAPQDSDPDF